MKSNFYKVSLIASLLVSLSCVHVVAQYCTTNLYTNGCQYGDYIDNLIVGSINQTGTGCGSGTLGFSDYTSLSTEFEQGSTYSLTVSVGYYGMYVSMWIDMDDDSIFEASEKLVSYLYCSTPFVNYSSNFTMPVFAVPGDHRMRVRSVSYSFPVDPCLQYTYGEVHDYTAHITSPANMSYVSSTTTQANTATTSAGSLDVEVIGLQVVTSGSLNPLTLTSINVNSNGTTDFNNDVDNVEIYYTGTDPSFSTTTLFGSSTNLSAPISGSVTLAPGINYFWIVYDLSPTATLGDFIDAEVTEIYIDGIGDQTPAITAPQGSIQLNYCTAENSNGCYFAYIDGITLNTLSNLVTYCNGSTDGYIFYGPVGSLTTSLQLGSTYTITLDGPPVEPVGFGVWIDFNDDGDFSDASEFVFSTSTYGPGTVTGTITIPASAPLGEHRMRVRAKDYGIVSSTESCTTFTYGETEDYTITLVNSTPMDYVSSTTTQNNISSIEAGETDVEIISLQIVTDGSLSPFDLTSITINSNGTTDFSNDVENVNVYYTGNDPNFATTNLFGSSADLSSPITGNQELNAGTNYFWITYDLSSNATIGNYLDAEVTEIILNNGGGTHVPTVTAPAGSRQVNYCLPTTTYGCSYGYIDGVIFNTLTNTLTGCNGSSDGYINYAPSGNLTTSVELGGTYNITLIGAVYGYT
ncbi:MAG: hypothetical protein H0V61_00045, partial [Chitinophagales bacterium]|nr:hypothetical protein [Chitinophagales bacterium]